MTRTCRPGPNERMFCGVDLRHHRLRNGSFVHPVLSDNGWWVEPPMDDDDPEGRAFCTRSDVACTGRSCWVCRGDTFTTTTDESESSE